MNPKIVITVEPIVPQDSNYRIDLIKLINKELSDYKSIAYYFCPNEEWLLDDAVFKWEMDFNNPRDTFLLTNSKGNIFFFSLEQNRYAFYSEEMIVMRERYVSFADNSQEFNVSPLISKKAATSLLYQVLEDLSLDTEFSIDICEHAIGYNCGTVVSNGWEFILTRTCGDLQQPYCDGYTIWKNTGYPSMCSPWGKEYYFVQIDERGICSWECSSIGKYDQTLFTDFELLPFQEIKRIIIERLEKQHTITPSMKLIHHCYVNVYGVKLCNVLVSNCKGKTGYMIPAWHVEYQLSEYDYEGKTSNHGQECFFINAIDGKIVEPRTTHP